MEKINIEVAYAKPDEQYIAALSVPQGTTAAEAIQRSGIQQRFPDIDLTKQKIGIFSRPVALNYILKAHDRVEIYRPLLIDPKEARRQRAYLARQRK